MTQKRILLLDTGKEWGGGTNSMFELLKRIDRQRFHVTCLFYHDYPKGKDSSLGRELAKIGIELKLLPQRRQPLWAKLAKELGRGVLAWHKPMRERWVARVEQAWRIRPNVGRLVHELRRDGYDLLYMNNQPRSNIEGYLAAETVGIPVVQHCRIEPVMDASTSRLVNRVARRVIGVSNGVVDALLQAGVEPAKCLPVFNGIDPDQPLPDGQAVRKQYGIGEQEVVFGAVGSLIERKGIRYVLEAASKLNPTETPFRILLVGDGPQRTELQALSEQLGVVERVIFTGFQPAPLPFVAAMDVCLLASQSEGLPRVLLEAMLLAKPAIASNVVGSRELVADQQSGLLVPYADSHALSRAMQQLLSEPQRRRELGEQGRAIVTRQYTIRAYVDGVERVLADAMER